MVWQLEHARGQWISTLHHYLGVVCNLPRLKASRFDVFGSREEGTFSDLARKLPPDTLGRAYQAIETLLHKARPTTPPPRLGPTR